MMLTADLATGTSARPAGISVWLMWLSEGGGRGGGSAAAPLVVEVGVFGAAGPAFRPLPPGALPLSPPPPRVRAPPRPSCHVESGNTTAIAGATWLIIFATR